jgi:cytochrome c-type biogenesis protein
MNDFLVALTSVFVLGVVTTIQPCPLSINISIVSLITGTPYEQKSFFRAVTGFLMGYLLAFLVLALIITHSLVAFSTLSLFLQKSFGAFLGPVLIVVGMIVSKMIDLNKFYKGISLERNLWLVSGAFFPSLLLGSLLALSFCPSTASIFFGIMVPFSLKHEAPIVFPLVYSAGAVLPLVAISVLARRGLSGLLPKFWLKLLPQIAGSILIVIGIYITLRQLYF